MATDAMLTDGVDRKILELLQADPRMPNQQIATITNLSETTIGSRLERLSSQNIARVIGQADFKTRGWFTTAFLEVSLKLDSAEAVISRFNVLENVITIYEMAGPAQLWIKIAAGDIHDLSHLALEVIGRDPGVERVELNIGLDFGHVRAGFGNLDAPHQDPIGQNDDLQSRILAMLGQNGRVSNREMARSLGVAEVTVRNRTRALVDNGLLRYLLIWNPAKAGFQALGFVKCTIGPADIEKSVNLLATLPNVFGTSVVTGPYNVVISIYGRDWTETHGLYSDICAMLPLLDTPIFRPATRFARHRFELAGIR